MQANAGKTFYIRPFPALDAIQEAVGLCAERGTPIYNPFGDTGISSAEQTGSQMVTLSVLQYVTELAGEMGVEVLVGTTATQLIPMIDDVLRTTYQTGGMPELYNFANIRYAPTQIAYQALTNRIGLVDKPAAAIQIGMWYGGSVGHTAILRKHVDFLVSGTDYLTFLPFLAAFADFTVFFEEIYGVSTYLSDNQYIRGTVWAEDVLKAVLLAIVIIGTLLWVVGFQQFAHWIAH
jgi:hypothetical protein